MKRGELAIRSMLFAAIYLVYDNPGARRQYFTCRQKEAGRMVEYGALVIQSFKEAGAKFGDLLGGMMSSLGDTIGGILRSLGLSI